MADAVLEADNLAVTFDGFRAVDGVSFTLHGGDLLGLIGPNGAGKTTLLRTLVGLQQTTGGGVRLMGQPLDMDDPEHVRHIGWTPDDPPLYGGMTVRQFLRFVSLGYKLPDADERIDFWLEKVWLADKAEQKCATLSRGMRQRVGLARTLLPNPSVVILDEPAAGLDPGGRVQFRQLLVALRDQGKAVLVSSHILADMGQYCSHVGIMSRGKLVRLGTPEALASDDADTANGPRLTKYAVRLVRSVADAAERLRKLPWPDGVSAVLDTANGDRLTLSAPADPAAAAKVLATLITHGFEVAAFAPDSVGLEEVYLRAGIEQVE